jgi:hypothetical protein
LICIMMPRQEESALSNRGLSSAEFELSPRLYLNACWRYLSWTARILGNEHFVRILPPDSLMVRSSEFSSRPCLEGGWGRSGWKKWIIFYDSSISTTISRKRYCKKAHHVPVSR